MLASDELLAVQSRAALLRTNGAELVQAFETALEPRGRALAVEQMILIE